MLASILCTSVKYISIHALLAESDCKLQLFSIRHRYFYPRSPCGERRHVNAANFHSFRISIHALLAESDTSLVVIGTNCIISIHALLAESDCLPICKYGLPLIFLSTLSLRRATY